MVMVGSVRTGLCVLVIFGRDTSLLPADQDIPVASWRGVPPKCRGACIVREGSVVTALRGVEIAPIEIGGCKILRRALAESYVGRAATHLAVKITDLVAICCRICPRQRHAKHRHCAGRHYSTAGRDAARPFSTSTLLIDLSHQVPKSLRFATACAASVCLSLPSPLRD